MGIESGRSYGIWTRNLIDRRLHDDRALARLREALECVENLAAGEVLAPVDQRDLVREAALRQRVGERGPHGPAAHYHDFPAMHG